MHLNRVLAPFTSAGIARSLQRLVASQMTGACAGLIFLSAMATSIADEGQAKGDSKSEILGTTLITLALATTLVGICIILVGEPRVQFWV